MYHYSCWLICTLLLVNYYVYKSFHTEFSVKEYIPLFISGIFPHHWAPIYLPYAKPLSASQTSILPFSLILIVIVVVIVVSALAELTALCGKRNVMSWSSWYSALWILFVSYGHTVFIFLISCRWLRLIYVYPLPSGSFDSV